MEMTFLNVIDILTGRVGLIYNISFRVITQGLHKFLVIFPLGKMLC